MIEERRYQQFQNKQSAEGSALHIFFSYDKAERLVQVRDSTGAAVEYTYNILNQRTKEKRYLGSDHYQILRWRYDAAGRMVEHSRSMDRADGSRGFANTLYSYDRTGNLVSIQTATGGKVLREYDAADRLISETHIDKTAGIHNRTLFSYDKAGNLVEICDNLGRVTRIEYDLLNREVRRIEKDGGVTRSFYDGNGNLSKVVRDISTPMTIRGVF
jgi:YD repeat-containing protein